MENIYNVYIYLKQGTTHHNALVLLITVNSNVYSVSTALF